MNYPEINIVVTELVNSFASMEAENKWDQFLKLQNDLAATPLSQLLATPEYVYLIFVGHIRFNDKDFIRKLRNRIEWPQDNLHEHLDSILAQKATSITASKRDSWLELRENHPSHAAMVIFIAHSVAFNSETREFLDNLIQ